MSASENQSTCYNRVKSTFSKLFCSGTSETASTEQKDQQCQTIKKMENKKRKIEDVQSTDTEKEINCEEEQEEQENSKVDVDVSHRTKRRKSNWTQILSAVSEKIRLQYHSKDEISEHHTTLVNDEGEYATYCADHMDEKQDEYVQGVWDDFEAESNEFVSVPTLDLYNQTYPDDDFQKLKDQFEQAKLLRKVRSLIPSTVDDSSYVVIPSKDCFHLSGTNEPNDLQERQPHNDKLFMIVETADKAVEAFLATLREPGDVGYYMLVNVGDLRESATTQNVQKRGVIWSRSNFM